MNDPGDKFFGDSTVHPAQPPSSAVPSNLPIAEPYILGDPSKIPPREFIYGGHYIHKFVTATAGIGGAGKSTVVLAEALAIATGRNLLGEKPTERCRVWYVNLEDPKDEIDRRIAATAKHYNIEQEELEGYLFVSSGRSSSFIIAEDSHQGVVIVQPVVDALKAEIVKSGVGLLIVDPFVKSHRVAENANDQIDAVISTFAEIAEETGACIELVPHLRKGIGDRGSDDIRGASALVAAVRSARIVNVMAPELAKELEIVDGNWRYLRVDDGKRNMAPPAESANWRRLESVNLGNQTETRPSDSVGVAVHWKLPDPFDGVTVDDLRRVQQHIDDGNYRANVQADDWVGKAVAEVLDMDIERKSDKSKIKQMLKTWLANKALKVVEKDDGNRKPKKFIEVGIWAI
ncbi:MAG: AAA family ATPase [Proteobacteria bacterium]|nr:AAA family ATPase [Pseudomonadota bacterium]